MDNLEAEAIAAVLRGETERFEPLIKEYSPRLFGMARRYARREDEVEDIVQEIWSKAYHKLGSYRGDAPFEHWLMRLAVRTCYDFLRQHQRNKESLFADLSKTDSDLLERLASGPNPADESTRAGAKELVQRVIEQLSPPARLIITLFEIEERPIKEIAKLTGWSLTLVKVRAFRARKEMRKVLARMATEKYL